MSIQHNAPEIAARLQDAQRRIREELVRTVAGLAGRVESTMRLKANKWRSTMANSVRAEQLNPLEWEVRPHVDYAVNVEDGRKPGKGLPRFFDPASASIVAWLESRVVRGIEASSGRRYRKGRVGSARRRTEELELRDRYMALSRHVKARGLKPHPFVKPTADEYRDRSVAELVQAVRRGAAAAGLRLKGGA